MTATQASPTSSVARAAARVPVQESTRAKQRQENSLRPENEIAKLLMEMPTQGRQTRLAELAERLTLHEGIDGALRLLLKVAGPGRDREWLIVAAVGSAPESVEEIWRVYRRLTDIDDAAAFRNGIASWVQRRGFSKADWIGKGPFSIEELRVIFSGAGAHMAPGSGQEVELITRTEDVLESIAEMAAPAESMDLMTEYFMSLSMHEPVLSLELLLKGAAEAGLPLKSGFALDQVLLRAVRASPAESIALIQSARGAGMDVPKGLLEQGIAGWIRNDERAAEAWFERNLAADEKSEAALPFVKNELRGGNLAAARSWLEKIHDPSVREKAEGEIWQAEKKQLIEQVEKAPLDTVTNIVSGNSSFSTYWLEAAMNTWISKDLEAATRWHEENWNSLPKEKSQYVAAAFAKQSLQDSDVDAARQWAALIQDPKTKARIEAAIEKAAAGK